MEKIISVKLLLKYSLDSTEIFEESVVIVKLNSIDEIKDKVNSYIENLNEGNEDSKIFELVSIIDYYEVDNISIEDNFADIYSRYLNSEELKNYAF